MAFFAVEILPLTQVSHHPNADRLDIAQVNGMDFQVVVGRDHYKVGDKVCYFPLDSLLPTPLVQLLGVKLSGSQQNRVTTVRLRGEVSQGLAVGLPEILAYLQSQGKAHNLEDLDLLDLTAALEVTKWEPEAKFCQNGTLLPLPPGQEMFDIEGADRFTDVAESMLDMSVVITEKIEGTNWSITKSAEQLWVSQRSNSIQEDEGKANSYWQVARDQGLDLLVQQLHEVLSLSIPDITVVLRGELVGPGIQGNFYNLKKPRVFLFATELISAQQKRRYFGWDTLKSLLGGALMEHWVPVISEGKTLREWLGESSIKEASNGISLLAPGKLREGIVIVPEDEGWSQRLGGRLILKQRSPNYLATTGM